MALSISYNETIYLILMSRSPNLSLLITEILSGLQIFVMMLKYIIFQVETIGDAWMGVTNLVEDQVSK